MRVGLMIPCYVDVFYPKAAIAVLELLEKLGVEVDYPFDQTCCGQPMANSGCEADARATEELCIRNFAAYDYIVIPSGSCTHHIRHKFTAAPPSPERDHLRTHAYDLVEFLHDILQVKELPWAIAAVRTPADGTHTASRVACARRSPPSIPLHVTPLSGASVVALKR